MQVEGSRYSISGSSSLGPRYFASQKVVRTDCEQTVPELCDGLRERGVDLVELPEFGTSEDDLVAAVKGAEVILHCYTPITRNVLENAGPQLRAVVKYGVGIDKIDIDACRELGIAVANVPAYGDETVAEGAFSLLISLAKRAKRVQAAMTSEDHWAWPVEETLGLDLAEMRLGLVGNGRIGKCMARMANGFRMNLSCYDPYVSKDEMASQNITKVDSIEALCDGSDAVSVHCVLNNETRGLVSAKAIQQLHDRALFVNVSRGEIADEGALAAAVNAGMLGGLGIDVFGSEPLRRGCGHVFESLLDRDDCIFTPHLAFWTKEARERLSTEALERCVEALEKRPLRVLSDDPRLVKQTSPSVVTFG